jgi:hypothetical protein
MIDLGPDGVEEGIVVHAEKESVDITNTTIPNPLIIFPSYLLRPNEKLERRAAFVRSPQT